MLVFMVIIRVNLDFANTVHWARGQNNARQFYGPHLTVSTIKCSGALSDTVHVSIYD